MKRNLLLLLLVIVLSVIFAYPFGYFVEHTLFIHGGGSGFDVGPSEGMADFFGGLLFVYSIFLPLLFIGWSGVKKWIWIIICILPILIIFLPVGQGFIIYPLGFFLVGIILGFVINWLKSKYFKANL